MMSVNITRRYALSKLIKSQVNVENCCCAPKVKFQSIAKKADEMGVASIRAVEAWSESWDQNLEERSRIWELRKKRWEEDVIGIIECMVAALPRTSK